MSDALTIDFGDGVSAIARLTRSIVMMTDGAVGSLIELGYRRLEDRIEVEVHEDGLPAWVKLRGERVFWVCVTSDPSGVHVEGRWLKAVGKRNVWTRLRDFFWK